MRVIKKYFLILMSFVFLAGLGYVFINFYSYIFSKTIEGQVFEIKRVNQPNLVVGGSAYVNPSVMHSYAVAIRTLKGEIITASGEDRKWEVVKKGLCANATFYPYPPWNLEKGGTYFNARLNEIKECPAEYKALTPLSDASIAPSQEQMQEIKPHALPPESSQEAVQE